MWKNYGCAEAFPELAELDEQSIDVMQKIMSNKKLYVVLRILLFSLSTIFTGLDFTIDAAFMITAVFRPDVEIKQNHKQIFNVMRAMVRLTKMTSINMLDLDERIRSINPKSNFIKEIVSLKFDGDFNRFEEQCDKIFNKETYEYTARDFVALMCTLIELFISEKVVMKGIKKAEQSPINQSLHLLDLMSPYRKKGKKMDYNDYMADQTYPLSLDTKILAQMKANPNKYKELGWTIEKDGKKISTRSITRITTDMIVKIPVNIPSSIQLKENTKIPMELYHKLAETQKMYNSRELQGAIKKVYRGTDIEGARIDADKAWNAYIDMVPRSRKAAVENLKIKDHKESKDILIALQKYLTSAHAETKNEDLLMRQKHKKKLNVITDNYAPLYTLLSHPQVQIRNIHLSRDETNAYKDVREYNRLASMLNTAQDEYRKKYSLTNSNAMNNRIQNLKDKIGRGVKDDSDADKKTQILLSREIINELRTKLATTKQEIDVLEQQITLNKHRLSTFEKFAATKGSFEIERLKSEHNRTYVEKRKELQTKIMNYKRTIQQQKERIIVLRENFGVAQNTADDTERIYTLAEEDAQDAGELVDDNATELDRLITTSTDRVDRLKGRIDRELATLTQINTNIGTAHAAFQLRMTQQPPPNRGEIAQYESTIKEFKKNLKVADTQVKTWTANMKLEEMNIRRHQKKKDKLISDYESKARKMDILHQNLIRERKTPALIQKEIDTLTALLNTNETDIRVLETELVEIKTNEEDSFDKLETNFKNNMDEHMKTPAEIKNANKDLLKRISTKRKIMKENADEMLTVQETIRSLETEKLLVSEALTNTLTREMARLEEFDAEKVGIETRMDQLRKKMAVLSSKHPGIARIAENPEHMVQIREAWSTQDILPQDAQRQIQEIHALMKYYDAIKDYNETILDERNTLKELEVDTHMKMGYDRSMKRVFRNYNDKREVTFFRESAIKLALGSVWAFYPFIRFSIGVIPTRLRRILFDQSQCKSLFDEVLGIFAGVVLGPKYLAKNAITKKELIKKYAKEVIEFDELSETDPLMNEVISDMISGKLKRKKEEEPLDLSVLIDEELKQDIEKYKKISTGKAQRGSRDIIPGTIPDNLQLSEKDKRKTVETLMAQKEALESDPEVFNEEISKDKLLKGSYVGMLSSKVADVKASKKFRNKMHKLLCTMSLQTRNMSKMMTSTLVYTLAFSYMAHKLTQIVMSQNIREGHLMGNSVGDLCNYAMPSTQYEFQYPTKMKYYKGPESLQRFP